MNKFQWFNRFESMECLVNKKVITINTLMEDYATELKRLKSVLEDLSVAKSRLLAECTEEECTDEESKIKYEDLERCLLNTYLNS